MKAFTIAGIVFLIVGFVTLISGNFPVSSHTDTIDIGPIHATVQKEKHLPVPTVLSMAAIGAGITLIILAGRK